MNIKPKRFTDDKYLPVILKNERVLLSAQVSSVNDIYSDAIQNCFNKSFIL